MTQTSGKTGSRVAAVGGKGGLQKACGGGSEVSSPFPGSVGLELLEGPTELDCTSVISRNGAAGGGGKGRARAGSQQDDQGR